MAGTGAAGGDLGAGVISDLTGGLLRLHHWPRKGVLQTKKMNEWME